MHRDSVGTIIDFVKDVSEVLSEEQLIHFQDVVLVDLDQNQVRVPSTSLLQLPEPEASILIEELQRFFHSDILKYCKNLQNLMFALLPLVANES